MPIQIGGYPRRLSGHRVLGRGGMGKVFRVRSLLTDREEAMKVVLPDLDGTLTSPDRFLREIKIHASLRHPNIAALYRRCALKIACVMILELVEGVGLEESSATVPSTSLPRWAASIRYSPHSRSRTSTA